jgi:uncharacterized protein (TIGR03118 family)
MALSLQKSAIAAVAVVLLSASASPAKANYIQTNLVSDIAGLAALQDPELVNPWGVSHSPASPIWVSDQGTSTTTLYSVTSSLTVTKAKPAGTNGNILIPTTSMGPQGPTGQVNNPTPPAGTTTFPVIGGNGGSAHFIFANLNGTISAWDAGPTAFVQATTSGALYTGLAIATASGSLYIYAANDAASGGGIRVFDSNWNDVTGTTFAGKFIDPSPIAGYVPFNLQTIGSNIYVSYAPAGRPNQQHAAPGQGYVDVYDTSGNFIERLITGGALAAPWGMALTPAGWGPIVGDLKVG